MRGKRISAFLGAVVLKQKRVAFIFSDGVSPLSAMVYVCSPFCFPQDNYFFSEIWFILKKTLGILREHH